MKWRHVIVVVISVALTFSAAPGFAGAKRVVKAGQACTKSEATKKTQVTVVNKAYQCSKQKVRGKTVYRWVLIATYDLSTGPMPQDTPATTTPSIPAKVAPTPDWRMEIAPTSIRWDGVYSCRYDGNMRIVTSRFAVTGGSYWAEDRLTLKPVRITPTDTYYVYLSEAIFGMAGQSMDPITVNVGIPYLPLNYEAMAAANGGKYGYVQDYFMDVTYSIPASSLC